MGSSDTDVSAKTPKASAAQETPPPTTGSAPGAATMAATAVYPDWTAFQPYSPIPPPGYFHSPVAWGAQIMPPYGTPPTPYVVYPHGGLYAHPSLPPQGSHPFSPYAIPSPIGTVDAPVSILGGADADGKPHEGSKDKSPIKRSKGSLGSLNMITGKSNNELGKSSGASASGVFSQSGESMSDDSSEGSDANSQNDSHPITGGGQDSVDEASQNGTCDFPNGVARVSSVPSEKQTMPMMPMPAVATAGAVSGPATNLNIGMDYWSTSAPSTTAPIRGKVSTSAVPGPIIPSGFVGCRESIPPELWLQDERELKRQRRKQSNRESARRSRLRKQAECEELAQRVEALKEENSSLKLEVERIRKEYEQLLVQNVSLKEKLGEKTRDSRLNGKEQNLSDSKEQSESCAQAGQADAAKGSR